MHCLVTFVILSLFHAEIVEGKAQWNDSGERTVIYSGTPINIDLRSNEETRIHIGESVEVGVPPALASLLIIASVQGIVYLTARQSFSRQRLVLKGSQTGRFLLFDVAAAPDIAAVRNLYIQTERRNDPIEPDTPLTAVQLVRHVATTTLAPRQTRAMPPRIKRVAAVVSPNSLYRDYGIAATLLAAWRTEKWLALTVELRNESDESTRLNPHDVGGVWELAGFRNTRLLPRGKQGSRTVLFLVGAHDAIAGLQQ